MEELISKLSRIAIVLLGCVNSIARPLRLLACGGWNLVNSHWFHVGTDGTRVLGVATHNHNLLIRHDFVFLLDEAR